MTRLTKSSISAHSGRAGEIHNKTHNKVQAGEIDKFGRVVAGLGTEDTEKYHTIDYARQWRERVRHENGITVDHAPYRVDTHGRNRTWLEPVKPVNFDPHARPATVGETSSSTYATAFKTFADGERIPRRKYVYAATTAQEIGWLRARGGHGGPSLRNGAHRSGTSHARTYCDVTRVFKAATVAPCVPRSTTALARHHAH